MVVSAGIIIFLTVVVAAGAFVPRPPRRASVHVVLVPEAVTRTGSGAEAGDQGLHRAGNRDCVVRRDRVRQGPGNHRLVVQATNGRGLYHDGDSGRSIQGKGADGAGDDAASLGAAPQA